MSSRVHGRLPAAATACHYRVVAHLRFRLSADRFCSREVLVRVSASAPRQSSSMTARPAWSDERYGSMSTETGFTANFVMKVPRLSAPSSAGLAVIWELRALTSSPGAL